jgi:hypothetical protein
MKKLGILAVLLAAGVVVASGLFAQEIKFDGYVNTGLGVVYSDEKKPDDTPDFYLAAAGVDSWNNAFRIRLHATYTNETGNAGAFLRLQASGGYTGINLHSAYGWFSALDNILTVKGGIVDDGTWNTGGAYLNGDMAEGLGALAKISPMSGLDIGVGAYLTETPGEGTNSAYSDNATVENFLFSGRYYAHEFDQAKYTFSLGYTLPDLVKFVASYRTKSEVAIGSNPYLPSRMRAGASLLAVPNLKAVLELELDNLQDFKKMEVGDKTAWNTDSNPHTIGGTGALGGTSNRGTIGASGKINIFETVQYDMGSLSVGLWAAQWLSMGEKPNKDTGVAEAADLAFYVNPWVSYTIGSLVPRLDLGYGSAARANFNSITPGTTSVTNPNPPPANLTVPTYSNAENWHRTNYSPMYDSDWSVISIRPSIKINLDANTFVEIGDLIDIDGAPKGAWNRGNAEVTEDSRISNVFYVDFKWSF